MYKKTIQIITHSGKEVKYDKNGIQQNSIHDIQALDEFDINVIDLSAKTLWQCNRNSTQSINSISDFSSISEMISSSEKSRIVIMYPQNGDFRYKEYGVQRSEELKNMLDEVSEKILSKLFRPLASIKIAYENTRTQLRTNEFAASFYFKNMKNILLKSARSNKATVVSINNIILSTLFIDNFEKLIDLLTELGLLNDKQEKPDWFSEIKMFDDNLQEEIIRESKEKIDMEQKKIAQAQVAIESNNRLKSILYTTGDELVEVIFEIFQEILECDLSEFVDLKKEDLLIETEEVIFIGEIKGVTSNVKSTNITQVDTHFYDYLETHEEVDENKLKALLIINHQRNKAVSDREPIMGQQINLAKRNNSLIIETNTLLKVLELYRNNIVTKEEIISVFKENAGLLIIDDFK